MPPRLDDWRSTNQPAYVVHVRKRLCLLEERSCSCPIGGRFSYVLAFSRPWPHWVRDSPESQRSQQLKRPLVLTLPASTAHKASATELSSHPGTVLLGISRSMRKTRQSRMGLDLCTTQPAASFAIRIQTVGQPARSQNSGLGTMMGMAILSTRQSSSTTEKIRLPAGPLSMTALSVRRPKNTYLRQKTSARYALLSTPWAMAL